MKRHEIEEKSFNWGFLYWGFAYGRHFMHKTLGGEVEQADMREFGKTAISVDTASPLFKGLQEQETVWMEPYRTTLQKIPADFEIMHIQNCPVAAMQNKAKNSMRCNTHPEVLIPNTVRKCHNSCLKSAADRILDDG